MAHEESFCVASGVVRCAAVWRIGPVSWETVAEVEGIAKLSLSLRELMQMTMKRVILSLAAVFVVALAGAQVRPESNHTVSTTLGAGLE